MKTIFLTGGNGFIGRNIIAQLKNQYNILAPSSLELNMCDEAKVTEFFKSHQIDIVIHSANIGGARKGNNQNVLDLNLLMFENIRKNKKYFKKLIQFGSGAEYDKSKPIIDIREDDLGKNIPLDEYGLSKLKISNQILDIDDAVSLKIFGLFGPYEDYDFKFISNAIVKALFNIDIEIIQNVNFTYVYIDEFIKILKYFIENNAEEKIYNIGGNPKVDLITIANIIKEKINNNINVKVLNDGLNKEYTCSGERLTNELKISYSSITDNIIKLSDYYKSILSNIDKDKIAKDVYAKKIIVNKEK